MVFKGNDTEGSGKPDKRKRNSNPLSHARGKQNKHENVWFKRSKAGYSLFVQYYMGQPVGTIYSAKGKSSLADKEGMGSQKDSTDTNSGSNVNSGQGMSRAAMRRNKKKHKGENGPAISKDTSSTVAKSEVTVRTTLSNKDPPSLLESAYLAKLLDTGKAHHNNVEFKAFLQAMSRQLPLSFRIRQYENDPERDKTEFDKAMARLGEQDFLDLLEALPFGNATLYRARPTKEVLCKERLNAVSPALKQFLVKTSQSGVLARQGIGSMLPVMALYDVGGLHAGSTVLDVCASPGSKTLQALEIVGAKGR
jgi:hypothetical protein